MGSVVLIGAPVSATARTLTYAFAHPKWKAASTEWKHTVAVAEAQDIRVVGFVIYGRDAGAVVTLGGLRALPGAATP